ncbi:MAG: APC family permease [Spirochaetes bacterium]|nr:APC family permease [Spirochaetota bacterium]
MAVSGLKRVLGLPEVSFIAIGCTIGGGIFVFTGIVLKIAGNALPLAFAIAVIPVLISMLPLAMLGSAIPATGANYKYPSRMVSPGLAFVGVWVYILASFFGQIPLYAISCARYIGTLVDGVPVEPAAVAILTVFFIVNLLGVKPAAWAQGLMVIVLIGALVFYSATGATAFNPENLSGMFDRGAGPLLLGVALLTFTYLGSNAIIELGDEINNPGKVIPRAFFIAFPVVAVIYVFVALTTVGAAPVETLLGFQDPMSEVCKACAGGTGRLFFVLGGAVLALLTTLNALFMVGTKSLLVVIDDHILPAWLGGLNRRFGTPHILLSMIYVCSVLGVLSGLPLETFASYAALGGMIIFVPVLIASLRLPRLYPERYERSEFKLKGFFLWLCPCVGFLMVAFFSAVILADLKSPVKIGLFGAFILSGIVYYAVRKRLLLREGVDLGLIKGRNDWGE